MGVAILTSAKRVALASVLFVAVFGETEALAAPKTAAAPDIGGTYQAVRDTEVLPGGLRNRGVLDQIKGLAPADPADAARVDPKRVCLPIGPFRMMAEPATKIELVPSHGMVVMLFEDISHGFWRTIRLGDEHPKTVIPGFQGDSIGRRQGPALVVDTVGFNDYTWLNAAGARHSPALHIVERITPILGGRYLEYRVTADDAKALPAPFTYVRYYARTSAEIAEDNCLIENLPRQPGH